MKAFGQTKQNRQNHVLKNTLYGVRARSSGQFGLGAEAGTE